MKEKAVIFGGGKLIHLGRPLTKCDISHLIPKSETRTRVMDLQGGCKLDHLAEHLMNGPRYGRK